MFASFEMTAEYVDSHLDFLTGDNFGGVGDGWLSLKGPLLPVLAVRGKDKISYETSWFLDVLLSPACGFAIQVDVHPQKGKSQKVWLDGTFDTKGKADASTDQPSKTAKSLFVLLLARLPNIQDEDGVFVEMRFGLILEKVEGEEEKYRRVGITDGSVKLTKMNVHSILSRMEGKLDLEPWVLEQEKLERDDKLMNALALDPWKDIEKKTVVII